MCVHPPPSPRYSDDETPAQAGETEADTERQTDGTDRRGEADADDDAAQARNFINADAPVVGTTDTPSALSPQQQTDGSTEVVSDDQAPPAGWEIGERRRR